MSVMENEMVDARIQVLMCFSDSELIIYTQYFKVCAFASCCILTVLEIACIFSASPREFSSGSEL